MRDRRSRSRERDRPGVRSEVQWAAIDWNATNAYHASMASITIRNLDGRTKRLLRVRAARHNCSMEEEARNILKAAVSEEETLEDIGASIVARFQAIGGVELDIAPRGGLREPPLL